MADRIAGNEKAKAELEAEIEKCKAALAAQANMVVTVEMVQRRIDEFKVLWINAINLMNRIEHLSCWLIGLYMTVRITV